MTNFANHPAKGGMPASEKRNVAMATASPGAYWNSPAYELSSAEAVLRATAMITANAPRFMAA